MLTSVLALKMSELDFWNILPCLQSVITAYTDLLYYSFYRNYHLTEFFQLPVDDRKSVFFLPFFSFVLSHGIFNLFYDEWDFLL